MNKSDKVSVVRGLAAAVLMLPIWAHAFDSGSSGVDGEFRPTVDIELQLPEDGVFNFTNVNIPQGVVVRFKPNTTNTPVVLLATGDVNIAGVIDVSGGWSTPVGAAGNGNTGDDGLPGEAGPGGFAGGAGGRPNAVLAQRLAGQGHGPGGGGVGLRYSSSDLGGGGGGFGGSGGTSGPTSSTHSAGGIRYSSEMLLPIIGGSGGGGGVGGIQFHGSGGGGGGGALLIAATGTVTVAGEILAIGGNSGASLGAGAGSSGGGGSGGAIRIIADRIGGNGKIQATGGTAGTVSDTGASNYRGGNGGTGRIRLEANTITRTAATNPAYSYSEPTTVFVPGLPGLQIESVAGVTAPARPTGVADIVLPSDIENPVTVVFRSNGVPVGNTVTLTVTPINGHAYSVISNALDGELGSASAQVLVTLPEGASTLLAQTTYTIVEENRDDYGYYTDGEAVDQIELAASSSGGSTVTLITESGRRIVLPVRVGAMAISAG